MHGAGEQSDCGGDGVEGPRHPFVDGSAVPYDLVMNLAVEHLDDPVGERPDPARYRDGDHDWLAELDDRVVHTGLPRRRMGTRRIDPASWLLVDGHHEAETALRARLLDQARPSVYRARPDSAMAATETALLVRDWLGRYAPDALPQWSETAADPLVGAAASIQEDLCLMQRFDDGWRLTAAVVCFPTHWRLTEKFDRPQEAIHAPVPHYAADLGEKVTRFFDRLTPNRIVARRNWGFSPDPRLHVPWPRKLGPGEGPGPTGAWLRSERQTLRRLVVSDAVLFTIRIQLAPVAALAAHPALCRRLAAALDDYSADQVTQRATDQDWIRDLETWLVEAGGREPDRPREV